MNELIKLIPAPLLICCVFLGAFGQFLRAMLGVYKVWQDPTIDTKSTLSLRRFVSSMLIGALAGAICVLIFDKIDSKSDVMAIIGFGYLGADAIEGIFKKRGGEVK